MSWKVLPRVSKGDDVLAAHYTALREAILEVRPQRNQLFGIRESPSGWTAWGRSSGFSVDEEFFPWQPIKDGGFSFHLRRGLVTAFGRTLAPSNANAVFNCPPNNVAGYFVWLKANISGGDEEEPADFESLVYEAGPTLPLAEPGDPDTGALPTTSYCPLCYATSTASSIDFIIPLVTAALQLDAQVEDITCQTKTRSLIWRGLSATPVA